MWKLDNTTLYYDGNSIEHDYDDDCNKDTDLVLKVSSNGKYAAICNIYNYYADFFKAKSKHGEPEYMYSFKRNTYHTLGTDFVLEFFQAPSNPEDTLFIFNTRHGELSVYNAESGKEIHTDMVEDKIITSVTILNDEFMHMTGWYWNPVFFTSIYDIKKLLTTPDYEAVLLDTDLVDMPNKEKHFKINDSNQIEIYADGHPFHSVYSLRKFHDEHEEIIQRRQDWEFTQDLSLNTTNLLHRLLISDDKYVTYEGDGKNVLRSLLETQTEIVQCRCTNNNTNNIASKYTYRIVDKCRYDDANLNYLVPRILFSGFCKNLQDTPEINLTFRFKKENKDVLTMTIRQHMSPMVGMSSTKDYFEVDPTQPCYVTFSA